MAGTVSGGGSTGGAARGGLFPHPLSCPAPPRPTALELLFRFASDSLEFDVEVEHEQFGLLGAVPAAHGAHQLYVGGSDPPHDSAAAAALQAHQVPDEVPRAQIPQLHRAVVRAGDHEVLVELETRHGALVLMRT